MTKPLEQIVKELRESITAIERGSGPQNMSVLSSHVTALLDAVEKTTHLLEDERGARNALEVELAAERAKVKRLKHALEDIYDKWEYGVTCYEDAEEQTGCVGNAVKLTFAEEQEILNLIVDKAEDFEQACANCGKPYRAHLLHDHNKCGPSNEAVWFAKTIADAVDAALLSAQKEQG
jgi:hypothetical protein